MAAAARAASETVEGASLHSLQATFLRRPDSGPLRVEVEPTRTGRSFATRRVVLSQEEPVLLASLSFTPLRDDPGWEVPPSAAPPDPEDLSRYDTMLGGVDAID